jgi:TrmH family RNA methyltransferase
MITSLRNDRVRYVQALQSRRRVRQRERRYVFEGVRLVEEAVNARVMPDFVFYTEAALRDVRCARLLEALQRMGTPHYVVSEAVLHACSDTETPQPILAVLPIPDLRSPTRPELTLIADGVRDPGNLGTMLRTALAAGVDQFITTPGTVDASNPKVIRAAMGAHLRLPIAAHRWGAISELVQGVPVWLAAASSSVAYTAVNWTDPVALVIGSERAGAGAQALDLARGQVSIPMAEGVESLNTAVATAVILFEIRRQRAQAEG